MTKNAKNKVLILVAVVAMALSSIACGGGGLDYKSVTGGADATSVVTSAGK